MGVGSWGLTVVLYHVHFDAVEPVLANVLLNRGFSLLDALALGEPIRTEGSLRDSSSSLPTRICLNGQVPAFNHRRNIDVTVSDNTSPP